MNKFNRLISKIFRIFRYTINASSLSFEFGAFLFLDVVKVEVCYTIYSYCNIKPILERILLKISQNPNSFSNRVVQETGASSITCLKYEKLVAWGEPTVRYRKNRFLELLHLFHYYRLFGDFRVANFLKLLLANLAEDSQNRRMFLSPFYLNALVECGKWSKVEEVLNTKWVGVNRKYSGHITKWVCFANKDFESASDAVKPYFSDMDWEFFNYVNGKTIAVVGPAHSDLEQQAEIDKFDIVIRTNYHIGSNKPFERYGERTDIGVYNHTRISTKFDQVIEAASQLKWVILKAGRDCEKVSRFYGGPVRQMHSAIELFFVVKDPMAIQNLVCDIMGFHPSRLKLFCVNLYCSDTPYSANYKSFDISKFNYAQSLRAHDGIGCYMALHNLFISNAIEADAVSAPVLALGREKYVSKIHELYGSEVVSYK